MKSDKVNGSYDSSATDFTAKVETVDKKADTEENLSANGNKDWAIFGVYDTTTVIRKNTANHLIGDVSARGGFTILVDNYSLTWQDGDLRKVGSSTNGIFTNRSMTFTLKSSPIRLTTSCIWAVISRSRKSPSATVRAT